MKVIDAANSAVALVLGGWLSLAYGVLSQLGDPAPWVTKAGLDAHQHTSWVFMFAGVTALFASLWLAGHCFSHARRRALATVFLVVVPLVVLFVQSLRVHAA
jgi:hypothetical protein